MNSLRVLTMSEEGLMVSRAAPVCGSGTTKLPVYILVDKEARGSWRQNQDTDQTCSSYLLPPTKLHLLKVAQSLQIASLTVGPSFHRHEPVGGRKYFTSKLKQIHNQ